jgi:glyoxylase-like metal-dependent hydrolase (beta-lactamase superfamily II)
MQPEITAFHHPATGRVTYLIADPATLLCAFVDPVLDYDPLTQAVDTRFVDAIIAQARARDLGPTWILETGVHTGHISAAGHVKYETGASICIGAGVLDSLRRLVPVLGADGVDLDGWDFDKLAGDGEALPMGGVEITAIALPGRLPGAVAYRIGDVVFTGAAILPPDQGLGDSDAPGADAAGLHAAARLLLALPPRTRLLSGQVGADGDAWSATVADHRAGNVDAGDAVSAQVFVARRAGVLTAPGPLAAPALQVGIRAFRLPPANDDGQRFRSVDVSSI